MGFMCVHSGVIDRPRFGPGKLMFDLCLEYLQERRKQIPLSPFIIHFRTASASDIGPQFCHPHAINDGLAFVHNGNLFEFSDHFPGRSSKDGLSDTMRFNKEILKKLPDGFLENERIRSLLEDYCRDNMSKMIFLDSAGKVTILNEAAGEWRDGIFYSNYGLRDYIGYGYSGAYEYRVGDVRHKGGIPNVAMLGGRANGWQQCEACKGWYKELDGAACWSCRLYLKLKGLAQ